MLGGVDQLARIVEVLPGAGRRKPLGNTVAVDVERLGRRVGFCEARRIGIAGALEQIPLSQKIRRQIRIADDDAVIGLREESSLRRNSINLSKIVQYIRHT